MKKLLSITSLVIFITNAYTQFNQQAPWMHDLNIEARKTTDNPVTFKEIVDAFEAYWQGKDYTVKGSGYKPFKRWENHWKDFVKKDGTLPTSEELYNTWLQVQQANNRSSVVDESNWQAVGPFSHTNTGSWSSGQGRVNAIAVDPNNPTTFYAGAPVGGIWKSIDSGATWSNLTEGTLNVGVSGIAIDYNNPNIIYIATGDDDAGDGPAMGVWKSIDGGATWNPTGLNPSNTPSSLNDIYIHPTNSNILYVGTSSGVFKTSNAGVNWVNVLSQNVLDIKIKPGDPNTIYAATASSFFKSTNAAVSFNQIISGLPFATGRLVIDITPANPNVVYVLAATGGFGFEGLYKSSDSGDNFSLVANNTSVGDVFESSQAWFDMAMAVSDTDENIIYTGVLNVWRINNDATVTATKINNWNSPFQPTYTHADIHLLRFFNGELFAGTDGGFYKSNTTVTNFTDLTAGMQISQFYRIAVSKQSSQKMVGGLQDNGGHAFNNNQWQNYYGADGMDTAIDPENSNLYYGFTQFGGSLCVSNTSGGNLSQQVGPPTNGNWVTPLVMNSESELYAGYDRIYKLDNAAWQQVTTTSFGTNIDRLTIDDSNLDIMYVAINNTLRRSTDRGQSFTNIYTDPNGNNITSIEVNNNNSSIVYITTGSANGGVFRSTDSGITFTNITGSLPNVVKRVVKHQDLHTDNPLYLGTSMGVYRYDDAIGDWELFNNNFPNVDVTDLEVNVFDDMLTASTYGRGIWQTEMPTQLQAFDIKLLEVQGINSTTISCDGDISPEVLVENNGLNTITSVDITYTLDGVANSFNWTGSIASQDTQLISLPTLNLTRDLHQLEVETTIANDAYSFNNTSETLNIEANDAGAIGVVNTFETVADELLVYDESSSFQYWQRGIPTGTLLNSAASGSNVYGTNLSGDHANQIKSYLVSQCYNLTNVTNPVLKFNMAFELELDWDIVYVEYSTDLGTSWTVLGTATDPNWYNSSTTPGNNCFNCPGAQWTGTNTTMQEYSYSLNAFNSESNIMFRIVFHSDQVVAEEGAIIDDFVIEGVLSTSDNIIANTILVYPNPSKDIFNIKLDQPYPFNYNIKDVTGKVIHNQLNIQPSTTLYQIDMASYAKGVYFLNITMDNKTITKKLIIN